MDQTVGDFGEASVVHAPGRPIQAFGSEGEDVEAAPDILAFGEAEVPASLQAVSEDIGDFGEPAHPRPIAAIRTFGEAGIEDDPPQNIAAFGEERLTPE